uniref:Uncharacterized protein n=1 Tax=Arundo donax TaxID=35708 RepID=A0A0A8YIB0_ARUDO
MEGPHQTMVELQIGGAKDVDSELHNLENKIP